MIRSTNGSRSVGIASYPFVGSRIPAPGSPGAMVSIADSGIFDSDPSGKYWVPRIRSRNRGHAMYRGSASSSPGEVLAPNRSAVSRCVGPSEKISRMRVWFRHFGSNPADVTGVIISGSNTLTGANAPPWKTIPFSGGASSLVIPSVTIATEDGSFQTWDTPTSWITNPPQLPRTDGGIDSLFNIVWKTGSRGLWGIVSNAVSADGSFFPGGWSNNSADWITTPPTNTPNAGYTTNVVWCEYEYEVAFNSSRPFRLATFSDSQINGTGPLKSENGFVQRVSYALGIDLFNGSHGGRMSFNSWNEMERWIPFLDMDGVLIRAWTVNDMIHNIDMEDVWSRFLSVRKRLIDQGYRVFVSGPSPLPAYSTTIPGIIRDRLESYGIDYFPAHTTLASDSTISAWASGMSTDLIHPNEAGTAALATAFQSWLAPRITGAA